MPINTEQQRGFTFVELVVAIAIFSFVLLIMTVGIVRLFNIYEAGIAIRATQQNARTIADEFSSRGRNAIAYATSQQTNSVATTYGTFNLHQDRVCFWYDAQQVYGGGAATQKIQGEIYYTKLAGISGTDADKVFELHRVQANGTIPAGTCPNPTTVSTSNDELITTKDVSLVSLGVNRPPNLGGVNLVDFDIVVAARSAIDDKSIDYSKTDLLGCDGTDKNNQYCSVTHIHSSAALRQEVR